MKKSVVKKYKKDELTVVWEPAKCIHSGVCVKMLPKVYDPESKPWIKTENGSIEQLKAQIDKCPSGALTYEFENKGSTSNTDPFQIEILKDGPILIKGQLMVKLPSGGEELKDKMTAFCRCGASANKPYCDGAHRKAGFHD
jgi:uncharacterized Fe-S cluster protein YjdI